MADWDKVKSILGSRQTTGIAPHPGDTTALIPHTLISVLRRLCDARLALSHIQQGVAETEEENNVQSIGPSLVREVVSAVQELRRHFEKILSKEERLSHALRGHEEGTVIWVQPSAQQDFVDFFSSLWETWNGAPCGRQDLSELVGWALKTNVHDILDSTGVERAEEAVRSVQGAFDTFQTALDKMLKIHEQLDSRDDVAVN